MEIRPAVKNDAAAIARIYNQAIEHTTASFDTELKTTADREEWLADRAERHPVLVAVVEGDVVGWGALSRFSERCAYDTTAEISVYVDEAWHRRGIGKALSVALLDRARSVGLHVVLARICAENSGSLEMVRALGFTDAGVMHQVGRKFGRWLDVAVCEYLIDGP